MSTTIEKTTAPADKGAFEPRIVAFVCKWCTYAGADLAGTSRMVYPPNVRTLMLPCTGRIDVTLPLRAFLQGADGVIISGCHPGDCHYTAGNYRARRRWALFRDLLDTMGFDLRRFELAWISAAEGVKWVKTISDFTDRIRDLGPYEAMRKVAEDRVPQVAPPAGSHLKSRLVQFDSLQPDAALSSAARDALQAGRIKAVVGYVPSVTLGRRRPSWITSPEDAGQLVLPGDDGNLARMLKNPQLRGFLPVGIVARKMEMLSLGVLLQEAQIKPEQVTVFAIGDDGQFKGEMDFAAAAAVLIGGLPAERIVGFDDQTLRDLDQLMALSPQDRWAFWAAESAKCIKCYACRGACPSCNCEQCFFDKNQPQWFPTAADGPGNMSWHVLRAFHLAGRCVGCGACETACPAGIRLNLLGAALSRSAMRHFEHRAGVDAQAQPLQSAFKPNDPEDFIL